jgi:uncharacterized protein
LYIWELDSQIYKKMINRAIASQVEKMLTKYPIVSITGPRQSGKTTLVKMLRPEYKYITLENPTDRQFAKEDPKGFLETYQNGVILDEVQYVPELFSYLQVYTDERQRLGEYILTGSQNFLLMEKITQSLAGRVAIFNLLPFSINEIAATKYLEKHWEQHIIKGFYPRKLVNDIESSVFYENYLHTYVERDVRQVKNITDLDLFQKFIKLLAGRVGQLFNQNNLSNELGINNKTVNAWMTVLETSFIAYRLNPYFENFNKRLISMPKIYFYDIGIAAHLLGLRNVEELELHFAKGHLFENFIINEFLKQELNNNKSPNFYFWQDASKNEIDLIIQNGIKTEAIEIKSGRTIQKEYFKGLNFLKKIKPTINAHLVYGGEEFQKRSEATVWSFDKISKILEP